MSISARPSMFGVHIPPPGIAGPGPHLYWRILITANGGSTAAVSVAETQYYDVSGALLSTAGTASASSTFSGFLASNAFDGNFGSFWNSNAAPSTGSPQWIKYQFASPVDVAVVRIARRSGQDDQIPAAFSIQYSDDNSAWTAAAGPFSPPWSGNATAWSFRVSGSGYVNVRLQVNATQDGTPPDAAELEFRETAGGPDITSTIVQHAMAGAVFSTNTPNKAFDNNAATMWAGSGAVPGNNWIGQSFARPISALAEILWQERNDAEYTEGPASVTVQGSNDGTTWTNMGTATFSAWTAPGQIQVKPVV